MSGGEIVIRPRVASAVDEVIAGNTLLYGATGGRAFIAGFVGERFAVRNSGAIAIVEGAGDHACEYMTAGVVLVLGPSGRNFGAGMSGGVAFAIDPDVNAESVVASADLSTIEEEWLQRAIAVHIAKTGSHRAEALLRNWSATRAQIRRVVPVSTSGVQHILPAIEGYSAAYDSSDPARRAADAQR